MVFTVSVKHLSYKQDLSNIDLMLEDQESTYAILTYAHDVPEDVYENAMFMLEENMISVTYIKLIRLLVDFINASSLRYD